MQQTRQQHKRRIATPYCIDAAGVAPIKKNAVSSVWSREAGMSVMDGSRLLDDAGLSGAALKRNERLIEEVRALLAKQDVQTFASLMAEFTELVDDCGPLGYVRFGAEQFDALVRAHLADAPLNDPEQLCDMLHGHTIEHLATPSFVESFRAELQGFLSLGFVPREHRLAACAALLTTRPRPEAHGLQTVELPALYAVFRAQLVSWLIHAGAQFGNLSDVAAALSQA